LRAEGRAVGKKRIARLTRTAGIVGVSCRRGVITIRRDRNARPAPDLVERKTGYYEVYNQPNVALVDIKDTPIERITPTGIKTRAHEYEFDIIIYATGFDAITGAFDRIDIRGTAGVRLNEVWRDGPQTYLGVLVEGFPNLLTAMGPQAGLGNYTRTAEYSVEWVTGLIRFAMERGLSRIEATAEGVAEWTDHVLALGQGQLMNDIESWMTGVNRNVEGKQRPRIMRYSGGQFA
jgi:cation diffusion facilitator CzcD-associated flavoprotein CzcO